MRRAMEMEASPMLSQTGGEKGAHHCLDWDLLQLESGFKSVMAKYQIVSTGDIQKPGSFHQDCIFLNTNAIAEIYNCLTRKEQITKLQKVRWNIKD